MPFTLSHPAYLLPFEKTLERLSVTALVVGSMVPDFEFFLKMKVGENIGHHFWGILVFDLPLGLVICFLFHALVRDFFIQSLRNKERDKLIKFIEFNWPSYFAKHPLRVMFSLLLGIFSHLILDAFTHHDGWAVMYIPILSYNVSVLGKLIPLFYLIQIISSIIGLIGIYSYFKKLPSTFITPTSRSPYFAQILLLSVITLGVRAIVMPEHLSFWDLVMAVFGSLIYSMILIGLLYQLRNHCNSNKLVHGSAFNPFFKDRGLFIEQNKFLIILMKLMVYMNNFIDTGKVYLLDLGRINIHLIKPFIGSIKNMISKLDGMISEK